MVQTGCNPPPPPPSGSPFKNWSKRAAPPPRADIPRLPIPRLPVAVEEHRTAGGKGNLSCRFVFVAGQEGPGGRNDFYEMSERALQMLQIAVNVGMVEFQARQDYLLGLVVQKLRPFIEEGAVILISFQDRPIPRSLVESAIQVEWNTADKKTWIPARPLQDPSHKSACGSFPVCARDHDGPF